MTTGRLAGGLLPLLGRGSTIAALVVVVALPFAFIALQAVFPEIGAGSFARPLAHLATVLRSEDFATQTRNTLALGAGVVVASFAVGVPLAALRALTRLPGALIWDLVFLVPFMIPPYIATLGWIMTLQPAGYLQQLTGVSLGPQLFSFPGIVAVMTLHCFPVVYFAASRAFTAIGARTSDASRVFGAGPLRAFWRVTLPLATPALAASGLLVFAMTIEEYGTPAVLGARFGFDVLVTGIDTSLSDWPIDLPKAALLSIALIALSLAAFALQRWVATRRDAGVVGGKAARAATRPLCGWALPVLVLFAAVAFVSTGLPLLAILATALSRTISGGLTPDNLGLGNFRAVLADSSGALSALGTSFGLGLISAVMAGVLGLAVAFTTARRGSRGGRRAPGAALIDALSMLPNAAPGVVVALGLILLWNQPALPATPYNTLAILVLAYVCILLPQPVRYTVAAFQQVDPALEAAARVHGAGPARAAWRVLVPLVAPSVLAAMLLVFTVAARELVASLLVAPVGVDTIGTYIWRQFDQGSMGEGMAVAFLAIVATTLVPIVILSAMRRLEMPG
ncbi:ABC transporter permease [Acidimangrovimonas sediminis]|uniref:ABC transporter permease n=1 Tax=Acidimangrovimonas sediminis TaxID=2056283 RepID=UPI000C80759A|nr:iron ABC transporter permease [Acidimangrovimonas sediminis]